MVKQNTFIYICPCDKKLRKFITNSVFDGRLTIGFDKDRNIVPVDSKNEEILTYLEDEEEWCYY